MIRIVQPNPRIEDWRVQVDGRTVGLVWRAGDRYVADVTSKQELATKEAAFKKAREQARRITDA